MDENENTQNTSPELSVPQPPPQPMGIVNGISYQQPSISNNQSKQQPVRKPSKWLYFFIILGILQVIGVAIFFIIMTWAIQQANTGASGTEFIALTLSITLVPVVGLIAFINLVGLPIYMINRRPRGKGSVLSILSLGVSVMLVSYGAYSAYQLRVVTPKKLNDLSQQTARETKAKDQQFSASNAKPEITKDEAIQLLKTCQLKGFYYTNQTNKSDPASGGWGELSTTGVVLTKVDGQPYRISIADRLVPELVPVAREAQKTCGDPQFWHDGNYEQFHDGHWYFNDTISN